MPRDAVLNGHSPPSAGPARTHRPCLRAGAMAARTRLSLLLSLLLLLRAPLPARADLSFPDIAGSYTLVQGNLPYCLKTAAIARGSATLQYSSVSFDGRTCTSGTYTLTEAVPNMTTEQKKIVGVVVDTSPNGFSFMNCVDTFIINTRMLFLRPAQDLPLKIPSYERPFQFKAGVRYWAILTDAAACIYAHADDTSTRKRGGATPSSGAAPSSGEAPGSGAGSSSSTGASPGAGSSGGSDSNAGAGGKEGGGGDGLNMWVWLGPLLGAGATILGAIITVFKCTRRDSTQPTTATASSVAPSHNAPAFAAQNGNPVFAPPPAWAPAGQPYAAPVHR